MADPGDSTARQEELLSYLKAYSPERRGRAEKDMVAGHYRILANQQITELSSPYAKAYAVKDEKAPEAQLYALAYENSVPLRQKNITVLKTFRHPTLLPLLADGVVEIGAGSAAHYAVILARPQGQTVSQILSRRGEGMPESLLLQQILRPLGEILVAFHKIGISHNRINPANITLSGGNVTLGECVSEPSGFSQDYLFEPIERILTAPRAKADYAPGADCYALAMLALHLALGFAPFAQVKKEVLIDSILTNGAYHTLVMPWDLPTGLQDFFRGVLGDGRRERWDATTIESWLAGKRYNLILPTPPRETSRGFEFAGNIHYNRKSLAHALWQNWKEARTLVTDNRLVRWLNIHAHKLDTADAITRITQTSTPLTPQQEDEALARIIMVLDPTGPLRFKQISTSVEAIGAMLAHAFIAERHEDMRTLLQILDADLTGFWIEQQKGTSDHTTLTAKLQKARQHMRMKGSGFGMERALYDLNPELPCLSPMLSGHHAMTLAELLPALDAVAPQKAATEEVGDTHIAAFIASRLDISREIKLSELSSLPKLAAQQSLVMLKLLVQAQRKTGEMTLKGLTHWLVVRLLPLTSDMHSRIRQRKLQDSLRAAATLGSLDGLAELLLSSTAFEADTREFKKAAADYAALKQHITSLKSTSGLSHYAGVQGRGIAQSIAYSVCVATIYMTLKTYFHI